MDHIEYVIKESVANTTRETSDENRVRNKK
jgi:hypothetical protein